MVGWRALGSPARRGSNAGVDRVKDLRASDEDSAGAGRKEQPAAIPRILAQIDLAPFNRAHCQGVDDEAGFESGFDNKQTLDTLSHSQRLSKERAKPEFGRFRVNKEG